MPRKPPTVFPQEQRLLSQLGERLKLARMRRKLSNAVVAQRAGISRTSLYKVETGDPGATLGTYLRVLAVLGLEGDINALAADGSVGMQLEKQVWGDMYGVLKDKYGIEWMFNVSARQS